MWAYTFPLLPLLPKVLQKIKEENTEVSLVAPWWPNRVWSLELLELSRRSPSSRKIPVPTKIQDLSPSGSQTSRLASTSQGIESAGFLKELAERVARSKFR